MYLLNLNDYVRLALSHAEFSPNDDSSWCYQVVLPEARPAPKLR
jgi:hypothetical protein